MQKLGIVGQRGMVGSVLMQRMQEEQDFEYFDNYFFSTSQAGQSAPQFSNSHSTLLDAYNLDELRGMDIIITCQGSSFTEKIHPQLRQSGWNGIWIDAASSLRMQDDSCIVLDPVNKDYMLDYYAKGGRDFIGGNCTVSLMLLAIGGLLRENLVEWVSSMSYQAASGAGARNMQELLAQSQYFGNRFFEQQKTNPAASILELEKDLMSPQSMQELPKDHFGYPLALSLLPWIDTAMPSGQSREEWKAMVEANKILQAKQSIAFDGTCVRVGSLRCHAQGLTIKLNKDIELQKAIDLIQEHNEWVKFVPNNKEATLSQLTPAAVSGTTDITVGRIRKMTLGDRYLNIYTLGDQLLWGAAEPLRRTLRLLS